MSNNLFTKAVKTQLKLRMALYGPSGSGKTYTALALAKTLAGAGRVAVIDTEHGSASKYADLFDFDRLELDAFSPQAYIDGIEAAQAAGYAVLVIDSLSHAWAGKGGALEMVDKVTAQSRSKNSYIAWGTVTPLQNEMIDAIIASRLHVIATMRAKAEMVQEQENGKTIYRKIGVEPVQRKEVEYEFDIVGLLDQQNRMTIEKSRMPSLTGRTFEKPGAKLAAEILAWLGSGAPAAAPAGNGSAVPAEARPAAVALNGAGSDQLRWIAFCKDNGFGKADIEAALGTSSVVSWMRERDGTLDEAMTAMLNWATLTSETRRSVNGVPSPRDGTAPAAQPVPVPPPPPAPSAVATSPKTGIKAREPEAVRSALVAFALRTPAPAGDDLVKGAMTSLSHVAKGNDSQRKAILFFLFGKQSGSDLSAGECLALQLWSGVRQVGDAWQPAAVAVTEAQSVLRAAELERAPQLPFSQ